MQSWPSIPDESDPTVVKALDLSVLCYFAMLEEIYKDQGTHFQSQLMSELCKIWWLNHSWGTPYHLQKLKFLSGTAVC